MIETKEAWEGFLQDWQVHSLLESVGMPDASEPLPSCPVDSPRAGGPLLRVDHVTRHLSRELLDALRVQAFALGIALKSARADVTVVPLVQASAEVPGDQPWIRYKLTVDAHATDDQIAQLHRRVQTTCVRRLECECDAPIAGCVVNIRVDAVQE